MERNEVPFQTTSRSIHYNVINRVMVLRISTQIVAINFGGYSLMAEYGLVAPQMRVRFSLSPSTTPHSLLIFLSRKAETSTVFALTFLLYFILKHLFMDEEDMYVLRRRACGIAKSVKIYILCAPSTNSAFLSYLQNDIVQVL